MSRVMNWVKVPRNKVVCWSVLITLIVPWVFPLFHISTAVRVGVLFILINMLSALWIGRTPVLFTLMVFLRYKWYAYFFAPIYLLLGVLAMAKD